MIRGKDVVTPEDMLYAVLCWASRVNLKPRILEQLLVQPDVLNYLEEVVRERRERDGLPT